MRCPTDPQLDAQIREVLTFMARNVQNRPMLHDLLLTDLERWDQIPPVQRPCVFERDVRRFAVACPTLASKDRIRHAQEALRSASAR